MYIFAFFLIPMCYVQHVFVQKNKSEKKSHPSFIILHPLHKFSQKIWPEAKVSRALSLLNGSKATTIWSKKSYKTNKSSLGFLKCYNQNELSMIFKNKPENPFNLWSRNGISSSRKIIQNMCQKICQKISQNINQKICSKIYQKF